MLFKESAAVTYALYQYADKEITHDNIYEYLDLVDRDGYFYYQITDLELIEFVNEYRDKVRTDKPIVLDMIKFNRIFKIVKDICRDAKKRA